MSAYPPISDYGLIGDCHTAALVSRRGSVDWCCLPRFDSGSCFGRLLDVRRGGYCAVEPADGSAESFQRYLEDTLVLETTFRGEAGEARLLDCFAMRAGGAAHPRRELLRIVEARRGALSFRVRVEPRFDYGELRPWIRHEGVGVHSALGGDDGLVIACDAELEPAGEDDALEAAFVLHAGERARLSIAFMRPEEIDRGPPPPPSSDEIDRRLDETIRWWREWSGRTRAPEADRVGVGRSALVLKALTYAPTGAIVAAPTTSLPESPGGGRTWDYRYSWVRDSVFSSRSLADIGHEGAADRFRRFIERSAAGRAEDLKVAYGVGGERRLDEVVVGSLEGYRGGGPVRAGNAASDQTQLDVYGELLNLIWRWHRRGSSPDDDDWRFVLRLVDAAVERWEEPDAGIWEWRGEPRHFVHSKVMCWSAVDRGLALAEECMRRAPVERWRTARERIREAIEERGYDADRGVFVQAFDRPELDAALLRLPTIDFVAYDDERMVRTTDAIRAELGRDGLLMRYRTDDGNEQEEGAFLACSFWLAECLARQGRPLEARAAFDRALAAANDLGLFPEEYDPGRRRMLGNFPQALTHLSHVVAALAVDEAARAAGGAHAQDPPSASITSSGPSKT